MFVLQLASCKMAERMRSKACGDLARMAFEELDPELNQILWLDHVHPFHDSILGQGYEPL